MALAYTKSVVSVLDNASLSWGRKSFDLALIKALHDI